MAVAMEAVCQSSTGRLRCWDLPYTEVRTPSTARPSRGAIRERARLSQRPCIAAADKTTAPARQPAAHPGSEAIVHEPRPHHERPPSIKLDITSHPPSYELSAGPEGLSPSRDRSHGTWSPKQMEEEVQRLAVLLQGLSRDFAMVKDSLWHLEDERNLGQDRMDHFEKVEVAALRSASEAIETRLGDMGSTVADLDVQIKELQESNVQTFKLASRVKELESRVDLQDHSVVCRIDLLGARLEVVEGQLDRLLGISPPFDTELEEACKDPRDDEGGASQGPEGDVRAVSTCAGGSSRCTSSAATKGSTTINVQSSDLVRFRDLLDMSVEDLSCRMDLLDARLAAQEDRVTGFEGWRHPSLAGSFGRRSVAEMEPRTAGALELAATVSPPELVTPQALVKVNFEARGQALRAVRQRRSSAPAVHVGIERRGRVFPGWALRSPSDCSWEVTTQGAESVDHVPEWPESVVDPHGSALP